MATVEIKGVKDLAKRINRNLRIEINKLFRDKALKERIGKIIAEDIKDNVDFGTPKKKTLKWREKHDDNKLNITDPKYRRNKLNATFTGELLQDLATNIKAVPTDLKFEIGHSEKRHKKYNSKKGKTGSRSKYTEISEGLIEKLGYNYFKLSDDGKDLVTKEVRDAIFKLLAKY